MMFLVTGTISISHYMSDRKPEKHTTIRLVEASGWEEAEAKFKAHYNAMTDQYATYYSVEDVEATEPIV